MRPTGNKRLSNSRQPPDGNFNLVLMIIKGIFRRYQRWNPVHPTYGTFWGMGIGIGCGVGWGPGFGPDVIGYVGAGCGIGFSVGITLAGVGIGLPANYLIHVPYIAKKSRALDFTSFHDFLTLKDVGDTWRNHIELQISEMQRETCTRITDLGASPE